MITISIRTVANNRRRGFDRLANDTGHLRD